MNDLSLTRKFVLISLNGEVQKTTVFISLKERCMVISLLLDLIVNKRLLSVKEYNCIACDSAAEWNESERTLYNIWKEKGINGDTLSDLMKQSLDMPKKQMNHYSKNLIDEMEAEKQIEIIPSLLECDLNYQTSGIKIKEYRSVSPQYQNVMNAVKGEIFNEGTISDETVSLVWLLMQSGDLTKIFTPKEINKIEGIITDMRRKNIFAEALYNITVMGMVSRAWKAILTHKREFAKTPLGSGIAAKIPALERSKAIFIQTEKMFSDSWERTDDVKRILELNGHICKVKTVGAVSLMEIDHVLYELVPDAVRVRLINIHGVRLRRHVISITETNK